jgi:hypothetical protein
MDTLSAQLLQLGNAPSNIGVADERPIRSVDDFDQSAVVDDADEEIVSRRDDLLTESLLQLGKAPSNIGVADERPIRRDDDALGRPVNRPDLLSEQLLQLGSTPSSVCKPDMRSSAARRDDDLIGRTPSDKYYDGLVAAKPLRESKPDDSKKEPAADEKAIEKLIEKEVAKRVAEQVAKAAVKSTAVVKPVEKEVAKNAAVKPVSRRLEKRTTKKSLAESGRALEAKREPVASQAAEEKPLDPIEAFLQLAKEEGHEKGNDAVYIANIGSPTDSAEHYRLTIALPDYIYFKLRKALGEHRMDILTWKTAKEALYAAGIRPTGKSTYVTETSDLEEKLVAEQDKARSALSDLCSVRDWIKTVDKETAAKMEKAMRMLKIGVEDSPITDASADDDEEMRKYTIERFVDDFQRFTALGEGGKSLMEEYEKLAFQLFHIIPGQEQGYVVLCSKSRREGESEEEFSKNQRNFALELVKKFKERLSGYPQLARISIHQACFGEVIPMGYVPEEHDVVTIDANGTARAILSVAEHSLTGPAAKGCSIDPQVAGHLAPVKAESTLFGQSVKLPSAAASSSVK